MTEKKNDTEVPTPSNKFFQRGSLKKDMEEEKRNKKGF